MSVRLESQGYQVSRCDILDGMDAHEIFTYDDACYDLVVHCAAVGGAQNLIHDTILDAALFRWATKTRPGRVVYLSSAAAYPLPYQRTAEDGQRLTEDCLDLDGPQFPDGGPGWAKITGEKMAHAAREAGVEVTIVRPFSVYGEDQDPQTPFGAFIRRAQKLAYPFDVWGPGTQVRDWIHIDDAVSAILKIAASGTTDPVNLCTGRGISMLELAQLICDTAGYATDFHTHPEMPTGVMYRVGDPTRMLLHHTPSVSLEEGVARALMVPAPF